MPAPDPSLLPTEIVEGEWRFASSVPVSFLGQRNAVPLPDYGSRFGQDIEPAGSYLITRICTGEPRRGWESFSVHFDCPLVIALAPTCHDAIYGPLGWKARLCRRYHKGDRDLSLALLEEGWDGIVTVGMDEQGQPIDTREIVDLRMAKVKHSAVRHRQSR